MYEDFRKFERKIVKKYIELTIDIIKSEDRDHLIFSNRFMLSDINQIYDLIDLYKAYDGIAVNIYPENLSYGLSENEKKILELIYNKTGKPILIGEWSIPALDSDLYNDPNKMDWSWDRLVENQEIRANQAYHVTIDFYNIPYIVGAHWFIWKDIVSSRRNANRGLFRHDGTPYKELLDKIKKANLIINK